MKKMTIAVQPGLKRTEVLLSSGLLFERSAVDAIKSLGKRFALFCDERVAATWGEKWRAHLEHSGLCISLFPFPAGEQEKSRERKALLEDALLAQNYDRETCLIALGGGVTTDLVGFLASTYCRGVPLVFVPTTLLGMVDAAIGGKTGVNTPYGKNLIGTFYPAEKILIDPLILATLPVSERTNGMAEVIKYALIKSPELFQLLRNSPPHDPSILQHILYECIQIKAAVVEADFEETMGLRRILNFGHTIAHALELLENYHLSHGEAVAIGMLVESYISLRMGILSLPSFEAIEQLIESFPFALHLSEAVTVEKMHKALLLDKKSAKGTPRFVLLQNYGTCHPFEGEYCTPIPPQILTEALNWMLAQYRGAQ